MLALITSFFNPTDSTRLKSNYTEFRKHLKQPITTVELTFGDQSFFIKDSIKIRGNNNNIMWQKERLLNIALQHLPSCFDKVAWIDADILFENKNWFKEAELQLEKFPLIQLFENVHENQTIDPVHLGQSLGKYLSQHSLENLFVSQWAKPGLAWAAQRTFLQHGFFDKAILGGADLYQSIIWLNMLDHPILNSLPVTLKNELLDYHGKLLIRGQTPIGYVPGNIEHLHHGRRKNRLWDSRNEWLVKHRFCTKEDIKLEENGIYGWASNKFNLHHKIRDYFCIRNLKEEVSWGQQINKLTRVA